MKDSSYYGLGNDEYNLFKTLDNGKTWFTKGVAAGEEKQVYDRIIFGSTNNGGLTYSDDGGETIMNSDHTTGNWGNIVYVRNDMNKEEEKQYTVYASSLDDETIVYSIDLGETWTEIPGAVAGTEAKVINGTVYIYGEGTVTKIEGTTPTVVAQNATLINGELKAEQIEGGAVEGVLGVVLNQLFLPLFCRRFAGMSFNKLCQLTPDMTLGNIQYSKIIYGQDGTSEKNKIDYEYYCNMRPMSYSLSDIISTTSSENKQLVLYSTVDDELVNNSILRQTFSYIDDIMCSYRDIVKTIVVKRIMGVEVDISKLEDIDQTSEEYVNAVKYANMMINVQKGSVASILGTVINKVFALDNVRKLAILKAALFECVTDQAGSIAYQLNAIKEKLNRNYFFVNESDFSVSFKFGDALDTAIRKYTEAIFRLVNFDSGMDMADKYEKYTAAEAYKNNRQYLLDYIIKETESSLNSIDWNTMQSPAIYQEDLEAFRGGINSIYNDYLQAKKDAAYKRLAILQGYPDAKANPDNYSIEGYKETYPYIYELCMKSNTKTLMSYTVNDVLDESDRNSIKQKFKDYYDSYDFLYKKNIVIKDLCAEIKNKMNEVITTVTTNMDTAPALEDYMYLSEDELPEDESYSVKNIINNYKEILKEFKSRCLELLGIVVSNFTKNSSSETTLDQYYNEELVTKQNEKILSWITANEYNPEEDIDTINEYVVGKSRSMMQVFWNSYKGSKEVI